MSTPRMRPWMNRAVAMIAPEFPRDPAIALPSLHSRAQMFIDESASSEPPAQDGRPFEIDCVHGTRRSSGCWSSSG